jgi:hypothetical protein
VLPSKPPRHKKLKRLSQFPSDDPVYETVETREGDGSASSIPSAPPPAPPVPQHPIDKLDMVVPPIYGTNEEIFYEDKTPKYDGQGYLAPLNPPDSAQESEYSYVDFPSDEEEDDPSKRKAKKKKNFSGKLNNVYEAVFGKSDSLDKKSKRTSSVFYYEIGDELKEMVNSCSAEYVNDTGNKVHRSQSSCLPPRQHPTAGNRRRAESDREKVRPPPLPKKKSEAETENVYSECSDDNCETPVVKPAVPPPLPDRKMSSNTPPLAAHLSPLQIPDIITPESSFYQDDENIYIIPGQESDSEDDSHLKTPTLVPSSDRRQTLTPDSPHSGDDDARSSLASSSSDSYVYPDDGSAMMDAYGSLSCLDETPSPSCDPLYNNFYINETGAPAIPPKTYSSSISSINQSESDEEEREKRDTQVCDSFSFDSVLKCCYYHPFVAERAPPLA